MQSSVAPKLAFLFPSQLESEKKPNTLIWDEIKVFTASFDEIL